MLTGSALTRCVGSNPTTSAMRNGSQEYMSGFIDGRYPGKGYTWTVQKTTKRKPKDINSENKYTLFIITRTTPHTIIAKSSEMPSSVVSDLVSMDSDDLAELCMTLEDIKEKQKDELD